MASEKKKGSLQKYIDKMWNNLDFKSQYLISLKIDLYIIIKPIIQILIVLK